jgi:hypothetical protein
MDETTREKMATMLVSHYDTVSESHTTSFIKPAFTYTQARAIVAVVEAMIEAQIEAHKKRKM